MYYLRLKEKKKKIKTRRRMFSYKLIIMQKKKRKIIDNIGVLYYEKNNQYLYINIKKLINWINKNIKIHNKVLWFLYFLYM